MRTKRLSVSILILLASCLVSHAAGVNRDGSQCYVEDLSKTPIAAACVAALRTAGKKVTQDDILNCNIQTGMLTPIPCSNK